MKREQIQKYLEDMGETVTVAEGLDDALIGFSRRINEPMLAVYSAEKVIEVLMERDGMSAEEAEEFAEFNIFGAWIGQTTPIFVKAMESVDDA